MMRLLFYLLILEISAPISCADFKNNSTPDYFMGIEMKLPKDAIIKIDDKNKTVLLLKGKNLSEKLERDEKFQTLQSKGQYVEIALAFISANHSLFQLASPPEELSVKSLQTDDLGFTHMKFNQAYQGIPVWPGEINLHINQQNQVYLIEGRYIPTPVKVNTHPVISEKEAMDIVAEKLSQPKTKCPECHSEIIIFSDTGADPCLTYRIKANPSLNEGWEFFINAASGQILQKLPTVFDDKPPTGRVKIIPHY
jgi:Zn-dependent metalloprotease